MKLRFEWDAEKAKANLKKHRISFDEATTVFLDPFSITIPDPDHSMEEQRFIDIGSSDKGRVLVVIYTERGSNIRIISCRKATPSERTLYEEEGK
ncbi:MAG: BrnT family toxin [Sedimentisphaerales bacterium]|nr:BrnT family toxin [Sedimentisphaerales bacterium]